MPLYLRLLHHAFATELSAIWPCVLVLLIVGLVTSILQAVLQIEDATFALLPETLAIVVLALTGGLRALGMFEAFAREFMMNAPVLVHQSWY